MIDFITKVSFINLKYKYILGLGSNNTYKTNEFITLYSLSKLENNT